MLETKKSETSIVDEHKGKYYKCPIQKRGTERGGNLHTTKL